ncbi:hypothetical protein [Dyadobacter arcticus]|uniref:Uncharacterized protein n=1 Tax=Dyadobacter arcticus TaxID=1078754 RepID=A0ABX0UR55_9BACT|nr:hypothetical protein [Dyadobacter arcticus]NIJ55302.1 hypothetical protein [Dyadobacter arcticus]
MNTFQNSTNEETNGREMDLIGNEQVLIKQSEIIRQFFATDGCGEMIGSLHRMIEDFLFTENLSRVTPEMRVHIVNNLRVASLVAKLGDCNSVKRR